MPDGLPTIFIETRFLRRFQERWGVRVVVEKPGFYVDFGGETDMAGRNPVSSSVSGALERTRGG